MIQYIRKRDGRMDVFDVNKIAGAIYKAFQATEAKYGLDAAIHLAHIVEQKLEDRHTELPTVELVQDTVEETLLKKVMYVLRKLIFCIVLSAHVQEIVNHA